MPATAGPKNVTVAPDRHGDRSGPAPSMTVIAGEARHFGTKLFIESEGKVAPMETAPAGRVTRDGKDATVQDIRAGDRLTATVARNGAPLTLDATSSVMPAAAERKKEQLANTSMKVIGFAVMMIAGVVGSARGPRGQKKGDRRRTTRGDTILHRKPSD